MTKVLVLGAQGMLGSMSARVLAEHPDLEVTVAGRDRPPPELSGRAWRRFDARTDSVGELLETEQADWVVNAIAKIQSRIDPTSSTSVQRAVEVNALFPRRLSDAAGARDQRVIQVATDGVYSGAAGPYDEAAPHDAGDVYGQTKSLGEVTADHVVQLRCSIIGPERGHPRSLLGRVLACPSGSILPGFTDQRWNGVTSLHFAKVCAAIIAAGRVDEPQHLVPADCVAKSELLELMIRAFARPDLTVAPQLGPQPVDRRLATLRPAVNRRLWAIAGYAEPPTIASMLGELAATRL